MRKPWVWLIVALCGFLILVGGSVLEMMVPALQPGHQAYWVFGLLFGAFGSLAIVVGLIGALICCFLKPKTLDLPYASKARGFDVTRRGGE